MGPFYDNDGMEWNIAVYAHKKGRRSGPLLGYEVYIPYNVVTLLFVFTRSIIENLTLIKSMELLSLLMEALPPLLLPLSLPIDIHPSGGGALTNVFVTLFTPPAL